MRRLGWFCQIASFLLLPVAADAQAMVSYGAAAAAGSTAGTVAGSKLGKALDGALGAAGGVADRAAKQEAPKKTEAKKTKSPAPAEIIHVSVAADPAFAASAAAIPSAAIRPKSTGPIGPEPAPVTTPVVVPPPPPVVPTP